MKTKQTNWWYFIPPQIGVVSFAYGSPGLGKTEVMTALAEAAQRKLILMLLDQHEPEDIGGFPIPSKISIDGEETGVIRKYPMENIIKARKEKSLMLVDEFTCVSEDMQAAALTFMASPPDTCWVYAAGNRPDEAANGHEISEPMINRMCVGDWQFDKKSWAKGMTEGGGFQFPAPKFPIVPEDWKDAVPFYADKINSFVNTRTTLSRPEYLSRPNKDETMGTPFPSPRSWTNAARILGAAMLVGANKKTQRALIGGCVGDEVGQEFLDFLDVDSYGDPEEILNNPREIELPKASNLAISYVKSVLTRIKEECTADRWENGREFLATVHRTHPEIAKTFEAKLLELKPSGHTAVKNEYCDDMVDEWLSNIHK